MYICIYICICKEREREREILIYRCTDIYRYREIPLKTHCESDNPFTHATGQVKIHWRMPRKSKVASEVSISGVQSSAPIPLSLPSAGATNKHKRRTDTKTTAPATAERRGTPQTVMYWLLYHFNNMRFKHTHTQTINDSSAAPVVSLFQVKLWHVGC